MTNEERLPLVAKAWETLRPTKSLAGMTITQFKTAIQPSFDTRNDIDALNAQLIAKEDQRDKADDESFRLMQLIVNAVKGDTDEGEDGELYEAMGYVRKSERKSGLSRKKKDPPTTPQP